MSQPPKPRINDAMLGKWQRIVDLLARILEVPAGLVMELDGSSLKVCVASASADNPYVQGEMAYLNTGLYCETVMAQQSELLVRNALNTPDWQDNPDVEKSMLFYLGLPLTWPDGEVFGTICVLDKDNNEKAILYRNLLHEFREVINGDLRYIIDIAERERMGQALRQAHDKLEQRVAERTQKLSETNTALTILLEKREGDKVELEDRVLANINTRVIPYLTRLKNIAKGEKEQAYLRILESSLAEITSSFSNYLAAKFATLTPAEVEISNFIRQGHKTKEIAALMNLSTSTIDFHRHNIRKKLGLSKLKSNLRSYLINLN